MRKRNILTVLGLMAAFVIAFGGWRLTSTLLDHKEEQLLSGKGEVPLVIQEEPLPLSSTTEGSDGIVPDDGQSRIESVTGGDAYDGTYTAAAELAEEEIAAILAERDIGGKNWPHEPYPGQISMEEAFAVAEKEISHLRDMGILPAGSLNGGDAKATLESWMPEGESVTTADPKNSLWFVILSDELTNVAFIIHALSGQIWSVDLQFTTAEEYHQNWDVGKLLEEYVQNLNLGDYRPIDQLDSNTSYCMFEQGYLYAVARFFPAESIFYGDHTFNLYMGLQTGELNFQ